jgi:hypothetical protein
MGRGEVSLRATWEQGGWGRTTPKEGFQVSKRDSKERGEISKERIGEGNNKGMRHELSIVIYCTVTAKKIARDEKTPDFSAAF